MSHALPIAARDTLRRGACPSLDAPMQTGDGLLARLRIAGGALTPAQLGAIAQLALQHGTGQVEITARSNLQVRGLTPLSAPLLARAVEALVEIERGLVVEVPPLAGDDASEIADPRALAAAIREGVEWGEALGPKVTVVVDGNGSINLAALKADIRLVAVGEDRWTISVGTHFFGLLAEADAAESVLTLLGLIAQRGPAARATDLSPLLVRTLLAGHLLEAPAPLQAANSSIGSFALRDTTANGIALPFGATDGQALMALAEAGAQHGVISFRLAPHHVLLALGADAGFAAMAKDLGFITDPSDPRRRISACIGSDGCASGHIPARRIAAQLAASLDATSTLHVSGCSKGCAHPRRAALTLVGQPDGYGLVIAGTAGDTPQFNLRADQLESAIAGTARQG